eukprot:gb/GEZN01003042.1/.p1 GENE.gb/GEZN01003042.1/~~gb/GEZN01003042.1/.p1  ORF type:complete len:714 (+),score=167.76 gb/GEZN01003042.1/:291-2144(+)
MTFLQDLEIIGLEQNNDALTDHAYRSVGTHGFAASVAYIRKQLEGAGYAVTQQDFSIKTWTLVGDPLLFGNFAEDGNETNATQYMEGSDFTVLSYGGSTPTDGLMGPVLIPSADQQGCSEEDYSGWAGEEIANKIALISRGNCTFYNKARLAQDAGAAAILIYNNAPGLFYGTASPEHDDQAYITIPILGLSQALGLLFLNALEQGGLQIQMDVVTQTHTELTQNILVDTKTGDPDQVIVLGSHLDSVPQGPGINDNGSGSALTLHLALLFAKLNILPKNKVRFAWWGAEEIGLRGSNYYVDHLDPVELEKIAANINIDMLASPNYQLGVYNGSSDETLGSGHIQMLYHEYLKSRGVYGYTDVPFDGRSDYAGFQEQGIAAGGVFSGAEGLKTVQEAQDVGGTAGEPYDACYHQACDDVTNINQEGYLLLSQATAYVLQALFDHPNLSLFLTSPFPLPASPSSSPLPTSSDNQNSVEQQAEEQVEMEQEEEEEEGVRKEEEIEGRVKKEAGKEGKKYPHLNPNNQNLNNQNLNSDLSSPFTSSSSSSASDLHPAPSSRSSSSFDSSYSSLSSSSSSSSSSSTTTTTSSSSSSSSSRNTNAATARRLQYTYQGSHLIR